MDGAFASFKQCLSVLLILCYLEELLDLTGALCQFKGACACIINEYGTCNNCQIIMTYAGILFKPYHLCSTSIMNDRFGQPPYI